MGVHRAIEWAAIAVVAGGVGGAGGAWPVAVPATLVATGVAGMLYGARRGSSLVWIGVALLLGGASWQFAAATREVPRSACEVGRLPLPLRTRVTGRVASMPSVEPTRTTFVLAVEMIGRDGDTAPACGRLRVRVEGPLPGLRRGERLAFDARVRRPRNFENPGRFDLVGHLARRGVHATSAVRDASAVARTPAPPKGAGRVDAWREGVRSAIGDVTAPDVAAVLAALVIGDQGMIAPELRTAFARAGVVHVLSVSGLHVAIVAGAVALAVAKLVGRSERILLSSNVQRLAALAGLLAAIGYGVFAGLEVATVRSVAMAGAVAAAIALERRVRPARALALAALLVGLAWPGAPAEIAYQLSFASVGALILAGSLPLEADAVGARRWGLQALTASVAAWLGTAPLTAWHFHQVSLVGVVANPIVVPLFGGIVLLPALAGAAILPVAPAIARAAFALAGIPLRIAILVVSVVGTWRWAALDVPIPTPGELVLVYVTLLGARWRDRPGWRVAAVGALCLLSVDAGWWALERTATGALRTTFLDVGQGDAAVVELPDGRVLVVDAGGFPGSDYDTGAAIVEPFLRTRKIAHVDALVMSHPETDHAGGLAHLVYAFAPDEVWSSGVALRGSAWEALTRALRDTGTPMRLLRAGSGIPDHPEVRVLHPPADWTEAGANDGSLVIRVDDGTTSILFSGDVERPAEAAMVGDQASATAVLKVPHHGSRTSSTAPFVAAVAPEIAVISVGAENRYGHPAPEVEARYAGRGSRLLRTDRCGAIVVRARPGGVAVETMRPGCEVLRPPALP